MALGAPHRKIAFTVPTGNFGDVYAGYVAARMGLPVDRLVVATNTNDILARTFATGTYEIRDVVATMSPSMDIQVSSNFERLLFDATRPRRASVRTLMGSLAQSRRFVVSAQALKELRALFSADRADEQECCGRNSRLDEERPIIASIRIRRSPWRLPKKKPATLPSRWWCCRPRTRRNFPMR